MRSRRRGGRASGVLALFVLAGSFLRAQGADSQCVVCHRGVWRDAAVEHSFEDWERSVHAKAGVDCHVCHGGNSAAKDQEGAHAGRVLSTDKKSPVYFTNVPETCGTCHGAEAAAFKASVHGRALARTGRGPNCVTCHGSMANHILSPRELEITCTLCHRKPTQASAALLALNNAAAAVRRASESKTSAGSDLGQAETLHALEAELTAIKQEWHRFDMAQVIRRSQTLTRRATDAANLTKIKEIQRDERK